MTQQQEEGEREEGWRKAAQKELDRLRPPHAQKKRNTVLALVAARIAGRSEESVWQLPGTCSRNTYHSKWKRDRVFAGVLEAVTGLVRQWEDNRTLLALQEAAEKLALAAPDAAKKLAELLESADERTARMAAVNILDRAGVETAEKGTVKHGFGLEELGDLDEAGLNQLLGNLLAAIGAGAVPAGTGQPANHGEQ